MLETFLRTDIAVQVSIKIMDAFYVDYKYVIFFATNKIKNNTNTIKNK